MALVFQSREIKHRVHYRSEAGPEDSVLERHVVDCQGLKNRVELLGVSASYRQVLSQKLERMIKLK